MTPTTIKANDSAVVFSDTILFGGVAFDLTGCSVSFECRPNNGGATFSGAGVPDSDQSTNKGLVTFPLTQPLPSGFPTQVGGYVQEWRVVEPSGSGSKILTFPQDGYNTFRIMEDLHE